MAMFNVQKPRRFNHPYIYVNERKEKLTKMEEDAKRELGMLPPEEYNPEERIRGKFVEATTHLKRRKTSGRKPLHIAVLIIIIVILVLLGNYLYTGSWTF